MAESTERFWDPNSKKWQSRKTKTGEDVSRALDKERFQGFRAPDPGSTPRFIPPKQQPGEPLGTYSVRVKEAKRKFEEGGAGEAQKRALKNMEGPPK